ncbi:MAG: transcription factor [Euryarchaeota archaeon]|nr:transcription factor [Euryarchaeota archaeon]
MLEIDNPLVREYFGKIVGEDGLKIMENIPEGEITDETIAKLSDTKLTSVRKVLYVLYKSRIAEYRTERDDNTGWITYWWSFNHDNIKKMMEEEADIALRRLREELKYERNGEFYRCHCQRILFEEAAEEDFWCEECESNFEYFDNSNLVKELGKQIKELEKWKKKLRRK